MTITYRYFEVDWNPTYTIDRDSSIGPQEVLATPSSNTDMGVGGKVMAPINKDARVVASQSFKPNNMSSHKGVKGTWSHVGSDWIFYSESAFPRHGDSKSGGAGSHVIKELVEDGG